VPDFKAKNPNSISAWRELTAEFKGTYTSKGGEEKEMGGCEKEREMEEMEEARTPKGWFTPPCSKS